MENMAPGYRFYPTEEELISFYLKRKLEGDQSEDIKRVIPELDIYEYNPWDLPQVSGEASLRDTEQWFFFIPRQESEARGGRPRRLTTTGYWKATGSPNHVYSSDHRIIGMKRTMVFYNGRAPNGRKTDWKMNEYKAISAETSSTRPPDPRIRVEYSVCRVYKKSKCLRAFDRRPPPRREIIMDASGGSSSTSQRQQQVQNPDSSGSLSMGTIGIASSPDESSSSGGDHHGGGGGQASQSGEAEGQMELDDEPLLDWEQVDWFLANHDSTV